MINKELIVEKYQEMKQQGITVDLLDQKTFGGIKVFINIEPDDALIEIEINEDTVYAGV